MKRHDNYVIGFCIVLIKTFCRSYPTHHHRNQPTTIINIIHIIIDNETKKPNNTAAFAIPQIFGFLFIMCKYVLHKKVEIYIHPVDDDEAVEWVVAVLLRLSAALFPPLNPPIDPFQMLISLMPYNLAVPLFLADKIIHPGDG